MHSSTLSALVLVVLILCAPRSWAPFDKARLEAREAEYGLEVSTVRVHLVEPEAAVILKAEDDPATIGGVGADEGVDLAALVVRQVVQVGSVGADGGDVGRLAGMGEIGMCGHDDVLAVRCPVLPDCEVNRERRELKEVAAVNADGEERLPEVESVEADEADRVAVWGYVGVGHAAAGSRRDMSPVAAVELYAPDSVLGAVESLKNDPRPVGRERRVGHALEEGVRGCD